MNHIIQHEPGKSLHGPDLLSRGGARAAEICKLVEDLDERTYSYAATAVEKGVPDIPSMPPVWTSCLPTDKPRELCRQDWIQAQKGCSKLQELVLNQPKLFKLRKELWYFYLQHQSASCGCSAQLAGTCSHVGSWVTWTPWF